MKQYETIIHSNGSKWYGQEPDSIDKLVEVLRNNTIEEMFFGKYRERHVENPKNFVLCPISKSDGKYQFFGNFEEVSHVFRIYTDDPEVIGRLKKAIISNEGWHKYMHKCKYLSK